MVRAAFSDAIAAAGDELTVEVATTTAQILEAQRLRYQVYCEERDFEPGENGLEQDTFDAESRHILVRARDTGRVYGTVRVVLAPSPSGHDAFPMHRVCEDYVLAPLPASATGEISRFALSRNRPGISPAAAALMRLFLMRGILQVSRQDALTHWCAIMESSLLRLLRATAIYFQPVGPAIEYHGIRQPAVAEIGTVLDRIHDEQPLVWSFLTDNGILWSEPAVQARACPRLRSNQLLPLRGNSSLRSENAPAMPQIVFA